MIDNCDHRVLGELVIHWAKGTMPIPRTVAELQSALDDAGGGPGAAGMVAAGITNIAAVFYDANTLVLRLPPLSVIAAMEAKEAATPNSQPWLPPFYDTAYNNAERQAIPVAAWNRQRIGDYTISHCG